MRDTINLQKLYDAGKLKPGDEFQQRNGNSVWFVGKREHGGCGFDFIFERSELGLPVLPYDKNGFFGTNKWECDRDIVRRAPEKKKVWVNVYEHDRVGKFCESEEESNAYSLAGCRCIGVLSGEIEVEDEKD